MMKNNRFNLRTLNKLIACLALLIMIPVSALADYQPTTKTKVYTKGSTTVYSSEAANKSLDTLSADYPLYVIGKSGSLSFVTTMDGSGKGFVYSSMLVSEPINRFSVASGNKTSYNSNGSTTVMPAGVKSTQSYCSQSMSNAQKINYMIYGAQSKLGCKYLNSGYNNTNTFGNGSFVRTCYEWMGYSLSSRPEEIGHEGKWAYIARRDLKRGDIVCFECDETDDMVVDHVGIYLGSGYFIHASTTAGCVIVSNMSSGYYYRAFCWGRRLIG